MPHRPDLLAGEKSDRRFENCLLPLGSDGETMDRLLVAIKFDN